jgi:glutaminase
MHLGDILQSIGREAHARAPEGSITASIPELQRVDPSKFGMHLTDLSGGEFGYGDSEERFSIQSISKVLTLAHAFLFLGERVWERVGVEPSGNAFNSLVQLEYENGRPRNPFINAGALVVADMLITHLRDPEQEFLAFVRHLAGDASIAYDPAVAASERAFGARNAALAHFLRSFGNIRNDVDAVLDLYFHQCAIAMNCRQLAHAFLVFANGGRPFGGGDAVLDGSSIKRLNALMQTCGFYDESGEFTYKVGLPGKSGVGGGIVAVMPGDFCVATWSPRLNAKGNSVLGMFALEELTTRTGRSIF